MNNGSTAYHDDARGPKDALAFIMALAGLQDGDDAMEMLDAGTGDRGASVDRKTSLTRKPTK